jgi:hypothetical protein
MGGSIGSGTAKRTRHFFSYRLFALPICFCKMIGDIAVVLR